MAICLSFLRVPDVEKALNWYIDLGFKCLAIHTEPECGLDWALLDWDGAQFMLYPDGADDPSAAKDAGLYFVVDSIDNLIKPITARAEVIEANRITDFGKKEIVLRDLNGFQVTFAHDL